MSPRPRAVERAPPLALGLHCKAKWVDHSAPARERTAQLLLPILGRTAGAAQASNAALARRQVELSLLLRLQFVLICKLEREAPEDEQR